jgi:RNA polymerase sigma factor (sigma-70 family)
MFVGKIGRATSRCGDARSSLHERLPGLRAFFAVRVDANDIDDMLQDVALRLQSCASDNAVHHGRAYLYQVARSVVTDQRRRSACRQRDRHEPWSAIHDPIEERCPDRVLEGKQQLECALSALEELPARTAQVFKLHRFDQVPCAIIAVRLKISVSAVEKHIMRATRHMAAAVAA